MRINLTKKDLVNQVYMQIGFSKQISESLINEFFSLITENLANKGKITLSDLVNQQGRTLTLAELKERYGT